MNQIERRGLWYPVCFGFGCAVYFSLNFEPALLPVSVILMALLAIALILGRFSVILSSLCILGCFFLGGVLRMSWEAHITPTQFINKPYYGTIIGKIIEIDQSATGRIRFTLSEPELLKAPELKFKYIRISSGGENHRRIGEKIMTTAYLQAPNSPAEPGGFDFQRWSYFKEIGAIGYTRTQVLLYPEQDRHALIVKIKDTINHHIEDALDDTSGAFAKAIITGDRSDLDLKSLEALRATNLAHLLAISGLHFGLFVGLIVGGLQFICAVFPPLRKGTIRRVLIVSGGLISALFYLLISGVEIAASRATLMLSIALLAYFFRRKAVSVQSVLIAAMILMLWKPAIIIEAGFQMSFIATLALVAAFRHITHHAYWLKDLRVFIRWFLTLVITSFVAGLATAPVSAFHFNQISQYGLLANILAVPAMGFVIMPSALCALLLSPFGLDGPFFYMMGQGIHWVISVAHHVSEMNGAWRGVKSGPSLSLALLLLSIIWFCLWYGKGRYLGFIFTIWALMIWKNAERPVALISQNASLIGILQEDRMRAFNQLKSQAYLRKIWLENDGVKEKKAKLAPSSRMSETQLISGQIRILVAKNEMPQNVCDIAQVVISEQNIEKDICLFLSMDDVNKRGPIAIFWSGNELKLGHTISEKTRPWLQAR